MRNDHVGARGDCFGIDVAPVCAKRHTERQIRAPATENRDHGHAKAHDWRPEVRCLDGESLSGDHTQTAKISVNRHMGTS